MANLRLPPFGRILLAYQQEKIKLNVHITIYAGQNAKECAYAEKKDGFLASFIPYGESAEQYEWPILNQKIILIDTGMMTVSSLRRVCMSLMKYEPSVIYVDTDIKGFSQQIILPHRRVGNG